MVQWRYIGGGVKPELKQVWAGVPYLAHPRNPRDFDIKAGAADCLYLRHHFVAKWYRSSCKALSLKLWNSLGNILPRVFVGRLLTNVIKC